MVLSDAKKKFIFNSVLAKEKTRCRLKVAFYIVNKHLQTNTQSTNDQN